MCIRDRVSKLNENLIEYDKLLKRRENEILRKKRLAFVGISLDNVLPDKPEKTEEEKIHEEKVRLKEEKARSRETKHRRRRILSDEDNSDDDDVGGFINDNDGSGD